MGERPPGRTKKTSCRPKQRQIEVTLTLDVEDLAKLDDLALEMGRSRSDLIREAILRVWLREPG